MKQELISISLQNLLITMIPVVLVIAFLFKWTDGGRNAIYANVRMVLQLLAVGYVLTFIFETDQPVFVTVIVLAMALISAWIALRAVKSNGWKHFGILALAIGVTGIAMLGIVTQLVIDLPRWFEPRYVIPLAGMILANAMNTVSLCGERFNAEIAHGESTIGARRIALEAAMIPQINALFAVGLVSLPGMMTGQILSGIDPLIAVRYQIMVMAMIFGGAGLAAIVYLVLIERSTRVATA